ncbi:MAG: transposase, partial [Clostridia bacterium]|nr:transposase [Clostridia bacterium]
LVDDFVIMPNHVHILLRFQKTDADPINRSASTVIQQMKGYATKMAGVSLWQKSFHDHIVRGEHDYLKIMEYIENNPVQWKEDCYYSESE